MDKGVGVLKIKQFSWTSYVSSLNKRKFLFFLKLYSSYYISLGIVKDSSHTEESIIFIYLVFKL